MRIECPHCHAVFEVPEARAKGVKRLRCANCGDSWELGSPVVSEAAEETPKVHAVASEIFEVPEDVSDAVSVDAESPASGKAGAFRATGAMASRSNIRRSAVLHSRSAGDVQVRTDASGPLMIGSTGLWIAAWGASLVLAGSGAAALWYCKGAGVFGFLPGVGHFS
ncbi:zinc-ribbon domain-containing protein [Gluconobacter sp. Dm-62]|uniref:zinc-ribbon domain-containing protein n=1 Tax=Gluconobacter sp. Dm-62 TaxID=2799804 RepID=UPI001B8CEEEC|nr:zinc-ribbon domain-containing protein [Gluconobacter sp. Dm-62]MBS1103936.1 zinc-ribbon domain-containing protein [Gluconobacter sp. Dm-62]